MGEALLEFVQGAGNIFLVGDGDVAPHRVGTSGDAGHLAESASANVEHRGVGSEFVDQGRGEGGRDHLREMADPGAEAVVIGGVEDGDFSSHFASAVDELSAETGVDVLPRERGEQPCCAFEKIGVGEFDSCILLARHGMAGEESLRGVGSEGFGGVGDDLLLGAADVGEQRLGRQGGAEAIDEVEDGDHGRSEHDQIAAMHGIGGMDGSGVNGSAVLGALENGSAIAADDAAGEMALFEGEAEGASDQAGADDGDLGESHLRLPSRAKCIGRSLRSG